MAAEGFRLVPEGGFGDNPFAIELAAHGPQVVEQCAPSDLCARPLSLPHQSGTPPVECKPHWSLRPRRRR